MITHQEDGILSVNWGIPRELVRVSPSLQSVGLMSLWQGAANPCKGLAHGWKYQIKRQKFLLWGFECGPIGRICKLVVARPISVLLSAGWFVDPLQSRQSDDPDLNSLLSRLKSYMGSRGPQNDAYTFTPSN